MFEGRPKDLGNSQREGLSMKLCTKSGRASIGASAAVGFLAFSTALAWDFAKPPSIGAGMRLRNAVIYDAYLIK
jgi:hypothetical protein